jgi:prepilin signal peptidase PulO-like enzyme (type II secretory pathway)
MALFYAIIGALYVFGQINIVNSIYLLAVFPILVGIFFSDIEFGIIPDVLVASFMGVIFFFLTIYSPHLLINHFLSGLILFLAFLSLFFVTKGRGMGFGDVKLSFAQGLFLGFPLVLVSVYLAFLTGALVSLILIAWGKKKFKKDTIPFGPFLTLSSIVTYFWGDLIVLEVLKFLGR